MIFGKYINRYYLKHAPVLLFGILSLLTVDYIQLLIPELYRLVINGVNLGQVVVDGQTMAFTKEVLFQHICLPMIYIVVLMVIGRFLWRVCFFGSAVRVAADLREQMFDHSRQLSQQYYQVNKVGNLMSLYTNDLDTIQECFGDGILMFFDASVTPPPSAPTRRQSTKDACKVEHDLSEETYSKMIAFAEKAEKEAQK